NAREHAWWMVRVADQRRSCDANTGPDSTAQGDSCCDAVALAGRLRHFAPSTVQIVDASTSFPRGADNQLDGAAMPSPNHALTSGQTAAFKDRARPLLGDRDLRFGSRTVIERGRL